MFFNRRKKYDERQTQIDAMLNDVPPDDGRTLDGHNGARLLKRAREIAREKGWKLPETVEEAKGITQRLLRS